MRGDLSRNNIRLCIALVVLAGLILRALAFAPFDISHADEIMQYLEQGKRLATGHGIVPWEYRYGARNELIPQLRALPYWLGAKLAPGTLAGMLSARWFYLALTLLALLAAWRLGALTSRTHALAALFVAAVWYENVLFSTLLLSEVLAAGLIALAAALLLADAPSRAALRWWCWRGSSRARWLLRRSTSAMPMRSCSISNKASGSPPGTGSCRGNTAMARAMSCCRSCWRCRTGLEQSSLPGRWRACWRRAGAFLR